MKRAFWIATSLGIIVCMTSASTLATAAPAPKKVIEDPAEDANGLNDQGAGDGTNGDNVTPADAGNASDLLSVSISNDAKNVSIAVSAQLTPPATQGLGYRVRFNPDGPGGTHCVIVEAFWPGAGNDLTAPKGHVRDACAGGDPVPIEILGYMLVVPRSAHKAFAKGATLKAPQAQSFVWLGSSYPAGVAAFYIDTTKIGTDYKLVK